MIKLKNKDYSKVIPLFKGIQHSTPLVFAIIEDNSKGSVFVDDSNYPKSAFIYQEGGFMYLMSDDDIFMEQVRDYILNQLLPEMDEQEMVLFAFKDTTRDKLDALLKDKGAIRIERKVFYFNLERFKEIASSAQPLSSEYHIQPMKKEELEDYSKEKKLGDCVDKKLGYRVMKGKEVVSECVSIFVGGEEAEIDIYTHEDHRGKGLGKACALAFIKGCLAENLTPSWSCWPFRKESLALAKKIGFDESPDVPAHFWAENM